jgi:hypothetical protein
VLAASSEPRQVEEIVVGPDRVLERRDVTGIPPSFGWGVRLDEAFDAQGRLHALVDDRHFLLADTGWVQSRHTPWDETGTKAEDVAFVHGAPGLIFRFQGKGSELGARAHWELWGFGNALGGIVWPWRTHGTRTVIVPEIDSAYPMWTVIEPNDKHNTLTMAAAADDKSSVCLIYEKVVGGLLSTEDELWFGCVPGLDAYTARTSAPTGAPLNTKASPKLTDRIVVRPFAGAAIPLTYRIAPRSLAVDPHTGSVLAGAQWLLQSDRWQGPLPGSSIIAGHLHVIAAGNDSFHAVAIAHGAYNTGSGNWYPAILYSRLSAEHAWSQPLEVGKAYVQTNAYWTQQSTDITATADGRVFIVWPATEGLVGRWVETVQSSRAARYRSSHNTEYANLHPQRELRLRAPSMRLH